MFLFIKGNKGFDTDITRAKSTNIHSSPWFYPKMLTTWHRNLNKFIIWSKPFAFNLIVVIVCFVSQVNVPFISIWRFFSFSFFLWINQISRLSNPNNSIFYSLNLCFTIQIEWEWKSFPFNFIYITRANWYQNDTFSYSSILIPEWQEIPFVVSRYPWCAQY